VLPLLEVQAYTALKKDEADNVKIHFTICTVDEKKGAGEKLNPEIGWQRCLIMGDRRLGA
jgi:hypothetical protein